MSDSQASVIVYLASMAALLGALGMGLALGYPAPLFIGLADPNTSLDPSEKVGDSEKSSISSLIAVGALIGGFLAQPSNKFFGRRISLILFGIPFTIGWLVIALANKVWLICLGRFLTGLCCGLVSGTAPTYVVEIAPSKIRGLLGTCFQVMVVIGIALTAVFGLFLSWQQNAWACVVPAVLGSVLMFFVPETPQWLLSKNRNEEAEASLKRLRTSDISQEFSQMTGTASQAQESTSQSFIETISSREFLKPSLLALALMFFQQFSGINAVLSYQGEIFKLAAPDINPLKPTIIVCTAQVIATIIASILVDRLGRRLLLLMSGAGHAVSLIIFGLYWTAEATFRRDHYWIALVSLVAFVSAFSIGYGPIPWMMIPELSSARVRSTVASLSTAFNWLCVYLILKFVLPFKSAVGDNYTYWIFALICTISCVFVHLTLPETKGKSSEQIQSELFGYADRTPKRAEEGAMKPIV